MKVIILCAGYATRLYPLTKNKPKPLLTIADKPIIEYFLAEIAAIKDIDAIYIVTNHKFARMFTEWCHTVSYPRPIDIIDDQTTTNENRLGAIGDIWYTIGHKKINDDILIVGGDNIFDMDVQDFITFAQGKRPYATIAAHDVQDRELAKRYGLVELNGDDQVIDFQEKPAEPKTTFASLALYFYPQETLAYLRQYVETGHNLDQPGHFVVWLAHAYKVYCYSFSGSWFDIGDFKSLEQADKYYRDKAGK